VMVGVFVEGACLPAVGYKRPSHLAPLFRFEPLYRIRIHITNWQIPCFLFCLKDESSGLGLGGVMASE
jgi:hypothetical protein